jgi:hypothetical protein
MKRKEEIEDATRGWALHEFQEANLGDPRRKARLVTLSDSLAAFPHSPINQACNDWAETKAAYRFFQNEQVREADILASHVGKTIQRAVSCKTVLAIQDTCYFSYTKHQKTTGLGVLTKTHSAQHDKTLTAMGIMMHTAFAVTTEGLPLGILDQKVFVRPEKQATQNKEKKRSHKVNGPIENKESMRWLTSLKKTHQAVAGTLQVVTVCDREGDLYEFFECAHHIGASVLVRASADRWINKTHRGEENKDRLWDFVQRVPSCGTLDIDIPKRDQKPARRATLQVRYSAFTLNPPYAHIRHKTEVLPNLTIYAILVKEAHPPHQEEALEWMLLTDLPINSWEDAVEKVRWYCLRWRIEVFHKILKSGLRVEQCRLQTANRLMRYLTVMSIIAWRLYWITLIARTHPQLSCELLLDGVEWKVLYSRIHKTKSYPEQPPPMRDVVRWIAMLGGFLGRKSDGEPGIITLWRGWMRLCDLSEGWRLAQNK